MGANVTKTPVEKLKIDETNDDFEDNDIHNIANANKINGLSEDGPNIENQFTEQLTNDSNWNFNYGIEYPNEEPGNESQLSINDRVHEMQRNPSPHMEDQPMMENIDESDENYDHDIMNEAVYVERKPKPMEMNRFEKSQSLPTYRRNLEVVNDIEEIDDLESIQSGSKLTLNDNKSDSEDVIQELSKLNIDLEENDRYPPNYRKRGQSWSNWDNNVHVDLKTESSLSSFSRPASIDTQPLKTKSYTAPEMRQQSDSAIEWLAKQQGLEIGSGSEHESKQKTKEINSRNTLRLSSVEIPGSVATPSTPAVNEYDSHPKYDDLDKKLIDSIENEYIR